MIRYDNTPEQNVCVVDAESKRLEAKARRLAKQTPNKELDQMEKAIRTIEKGLEQLEECARSIRPLYVEVARQHLESEFDQFVKQFQRMKQQLIRTDNDSTEQSGTTD